MAQQNRARGRRAEKQHPYHRFLAEVKAGQIRSNYLLWGEEAFLIQALIGTLKKNLIEPSSEDLDYQVVDGRAQAGGLDWPQIINAAETPAFFSARRLIVLRATGIFNAASPSQATEELLGQLFARGAQSAVLVFWEEQVDKRRRIFKKLPPETFAEDFGPLPDSEVQAWLRRKLGQDQLELSPEALQRLIELTQARLLDLNQECQKLKLWAQACGRQYLDLEAVEELCAHDLEQEVFRLVEACIQDVEQGLSVLRQLLAQREAAVLLLFLLARQLRQLLVAQDLPARDLASALKLRPFVASKLQEQSRHFRPRDLARLYHLAEKLDGDIKSGLVREDLGLEGLILELAAARRR